MDPSQILNQILATAGLSAGQLPGDANLSFWTIVRSLIILVVVYFAARFVRDFLTRAFKRTNLETRIATLLLQISFYGIIALGVIWVLGGFGLSVVVLGVAAGFALKDLLQNFAAGLLIIGTRPFQLGDWIVVSGIEGKVAEVGWRGTFIDAFDGRRVIVPNSNVITSIVTNNSHKTQLRNAITFSVDLHGDFARIERVILSALSGVEGISTDPAPSVLIDTMSGNAMNLLILFWVTDPVNQERRVVSAAQRAIKEALVADAIDLSPASSVVMPKNRDA